MDFITNLPEYIQYAIAIVGSLGGFATILSGLFKVFNYKKGVAICAALGFDFAKIAAILQGFEPQNKPKLEGEVKTEGK
jgi:UDP-N-acetylmuramyl tripeptide synthase